MNRKWKLLLALVVTAGAILFLLGFRLHIGYFAEDRQAALAAEAQLIRLFNSKQFDAIYDQAADAMRATVGREQAVQAMEATIKMYGPIVEDVEGATTCFPDQVRMLRWMKSSNGTDLTQLSQWSTPGDEAKLLMMNIFPGHDVADPEIVNRHRCAPRH